MHSTSPRRDEWISLDNLVPFLTFIARRAKYDALPEEIQAIEFGVRETDSERDRWYEYQFAGESIVRLWIAGDPGTSVIWWRVECCEAIREAIATAGELMAEYRLV